jgi:hypothetical protein
MELLPKLFDEHLIPEVINLYRHSSNSVYIEGKRSDRYITPNVGMFILSKYTDDEFKFIWDNIKDKLSGYTPIDNRILKYRTNCFIPNHIDVTKDGRPVSNQSLIIKLSDPDSYQGGEVIVDKQLIELQPGDGLMYGYGEEHEVKKVRGERFVINFRLFKD